MLFPLIVAIVAVALGAALALGPSARAKFVAPIRIVSIVAAFGVIVVHLLPEAVAALGAWSAVAFAAGLVVPRGAEWAVEHLVGTGRTPALRAADDISDGDRPRSTAALDVGYAGLVVHRFGDGLSMGAYSRVPGSIAARAPVILAFAAHVVPVTTVMVLAVLAAKGRRAAGFYAAGLGAAIATGVVAASAALVDASQGVEPWISAIVAGLLLHVVVHGAGERPSVFAAKKG